jgi:hypothetical protein
VSEIHSFKPSPFRKPVHCRIEAGAVELVRGATVRTRLPLAAVTAARWSELADGYQGQARRELVLWAGRARLKLLQKDGFQHGPAPVGPFYQACAATLRALAAQQPEAEVSFGSPRWARLLYAVMMVPAAVIGLLLIASAVQEGGIAAVLVLGAIGASFLVTFVWWVRGLRVGRPAPRWRAADLAAEMERWARGD